MGSQHFADLPASSLLRTAAEQQSGKEVRGTPQNLLIIDKRQSSRNLTMFLRGPILLLTFVHVLARFSSVAAATQPTISQSYDPPPTSLQNATLDVVRPLNLTSVEAIDPDFALVPKFKGPRLFPISCLLNAVDAALQLALGDYDGVITQRMTFRLENHPQVEIALQPYDEQGIASLPRKYAVWAVNFSINMMIRNNRYQSSVFFIYRGGRGIGGLAYRVIQTSIPEPGPQISENLERNNSPTRSLPSQTGYDLDSNGAEYMNLSEVDNINDDLQVAIRLTGSKLTSDEVFISIFDILRELSIFPTIARMVTDVTHIISTGLYIGFIDANDPPRTMSDPPYFQGEWLVKALARIPSYMVQRQRFREVEAGISVDNIKVGKVSLSKARPSPGVATA